ncbi:MAG: hypothetical protein HQL09_00950 [Nitrospirae bacterium]|nr:hypothetical protein [Nitrospirota bacterium]
MEHGSFRLDHYIFTGAGNVCDPKWGKLPYHIQEINGHTYYYYPPGSSVLSIPFVAAMHPFGISAVNNDGTYNAGSEEKLERTLAALLMAGLTCIFFMTARLLLPTYWSLAIAISGGFGTSVFSTASRAMWMHTWSIFLLGFVLFLLFKAFINKKSPNPILLATLLSWMYFTRPTNSISIVGIALLVLIYSRSIFIPFVITGLIWASLFAGYSWHYFGKLLPDYFAPGNLFGPATFFQYFWKGLAGTMISPARGLLVYTPSLLFVGFLLGSYYRRIQFKALMWCGVAVFLVHLITISEFPTWYAGSCYGPRYMTDMVPWLILLSAIAVDAMLSHMQEDFHRQIKEKILLTVGVILVLFSIFMHGRGALCSATHDWNDVPNNINYHQERIWSFKYPQFMAGLISIPISKETMGEGETCDKPVYGAPGGLPESGPVICEGFLDSVNGSKPLPDGLTASSGILLVEGWATISGKDAIIPDVVFVTLTNGRGKLYVKARSVTRKDVNENFKQPQMPDPGYKAVIDVSELSGRYFLGIARFYKGKLESCSQFNIPVVIK